MSLHFAKQLVWQKKSWKKAHAELEASYNDPLINDTFTPSHFEFEYDAVIDRALRYAQQCGVDATEASDESDADCNFYRYVDPARTIVVVASAADPKPELAGLLFHVLSDIPYKYRFAIDAEDALALIYPDGTCIGAAENRAGKRWLEKLQSET